LVRQRLPLLSDEKSQHIEFFGAEMDAITTHVDYSSHKIDTQLRAFELLKRVLPNWTLARPLGYVPGVRLL
jgi:hypothetical protein